MYFYLKYLLICFIYFDLIAKKHTSFQSKTLTLKYQIFINQYSLQVCSLKTLPSVGLLKIYLHALL